MENKFAKLKELSWRDKFFDSGAKNWKEKWLIDGKRADVRNTSHGMIFSSGPIAYDNASHAVLWTKDSFEGDIKIEWDFTRLDTITRFVNIVYIQATGKEEGPYVKDIAEWSELRQIPYMNSYFDNMNLLHISYAAFGNEDDKDEDYVRARRYPTRPDRPFNETDLEPDNFITDLFKPGIDYHFTIIKTNADLFFEVKNADICKLFHWSLQDVEPVIEGRVGIRHMFTRCSRYKNIKISTLTE
jgi:Domain of unknown function (DUF1961)